MTRATPATTLDRIHTLSIRITLFLPSKVPGLPRSRPSKVPAPRSSRGTGPSCCKRPVANRPTSGNPRLPRRRLSYTPSAISMVMVSQSPSWASFASFATCTVSSLRPGLPLQGVAVRAVVEIPPGRRPPESSRPPARNRSRRRGDSAPRPRAAPHRRRRRAEPRSSGSRCRTRSPHRGRPREYRRPGERRRRRAAGRSARPPARAPVPLPSPPSRRARRRRRR